MQLIGFQGFTPPLLAAILFYYITSCFIPETPFSWATAIGNLFNLQGICCKSLVSPFWSLSYEVWFYVILGALSFLLKASKDHEKLLGIVMLVGATSVFVLGLKMHYLLIWFMGAVAYIVRPRKKSILVLLTSFIGFFTSVVYWQLSKDTQSLSVAIDGTNKEFLEVLMSLMACLFIQQVILFEPKRLFAVKIEKWIGNLAKFSYTLYLSHRIVFLWLVAFIWPKDSCQFTIYGIARFLSIVVLTLICCWLIYLLSERYSPNLKKYLKRKMLKASV